MTAAYLRGLGLGLTLGCAAELPAPAKDIVWARYGDIDMLDPHRATSALSLQVLSLIYDTLLATNASGAWPKPGKKLEGQRGRAGLYLSLAEGVTCHHGTPLDATDLEYTVDGAFDTANPLVTQANWGLITGVEVVDPLTIRLTV